MTREPAISSKRRQRTIERPVEVTGVGFFTGADVTLRFLPAAPGRGIAFERTDVAGSQPIPALIEHTVPRRRRTAIEHQGVAVEMTEHVMAALAGLWIDNCLVQLDAPEPPGCDGSALAFAEALLEAGSVELDEPRSMLVIGRPLQAGAADGSAEITVRPLARHTLAIGYQLDYGQRSPVPPQMITTEVTPQSFVQDLAFARTFVLESEVESLKAEGYGRRVTTKDILVFGEQGVVGNHLRTADECARHKVLDCLGDFALIGCDLCGHFNAYRSGHQLNREVVRRLRQEYAGWFESEHGRAA